MHSTAQHSTAQHSTAQRIEYLDALRGFTMILVVLTHVSGFVFNAENEANFHFYLKQFRMPLFFFVSGFVFYKENFKWDISNIITFLKKKVPVQIISPFIFLLCYIYIKEISITNALTDCDKVGYWFTFTLFSYFIIYILAQKIFDLLNIDTKYRVIFLILVGISLYYNFPINLLFRAGIPLTILNLLGLTRLQFFIFFICGACVKKYFKQFEYALDNTLLTAIAVATYFIVNIFANTSNINHHIQNSISLLLAICGIIIIFSLFRKHQSTFSQNNRISNTLKFIGKRTLDIYLIHYFFIPFGLHKVFPFFENNNVPVIEFIASLLVTAIVIAASLAISSVLRINNTLAHYLFGAKK